jgi:hypothetical protein
MLHNMEFHDFHSTKSVINKSGRTSWAGHGEGEKCIQYFSHETRRDEATRKVWTSISLCSRSGLLTGFKGQDRDQWRALVNTVTKLRAQ